ncbi:MAG: FHA domain-containing protein, partial [Myxococcales bacterium]|nr:FHA domain-containing protein [Myxococcales bacterium]
MGRIRHLATQQVRYLEVDHVVGRASSCALHVPEPYVSARHASLRWTGDGWEVRDLGSLNGTYLDGARIPPGAQQPLKPGARVA